MFANLKKQIEAQGGEAGAGAAGTNAGPGWQNSGSNSADDLPTCAARSSAHSRASDNVNELRSRYVQLEKAYESYRSKTGGLLAKKDAHINRLQARLDTLEARVSELQAGGNVHSLLAERDALQQRCEQIESAYGRERESWSQQVADERAAHTGRLQQLHAQLDALNEQLHRPPPKCTLCEVECESRREAESALSAEQARSTVLLEQMTKLKRDYDALQSKLDHTHATQSAAADEADVQCEMRVTNLCNELEHLCEMLERTDTDRHMLRGSVAEKERTIDQLHTRLRQAEATAARFQGVIDCLREELECRSSACETRTATGAENGALSGDTSLPETSGGDECKVAEPTALHGGAQSHPHADGQSAAAAAECGQLRAQLQRMQDEYSQLQERLRTAEAELKSLGSEETRGALKQLQSTISELESAVSNRDATIHAQRRRLGDMESHLRRQLSNVHALNAHNELYKSSAFASSVSLVDRTGAIQDINFEYLRHVMLRFMTASDYEAITLVRAVAAILQLSKEEEDVLRKTLEWKQQWLPIASKPKLK